MRPEDLRYLKRGMLLIMLLACIGSGILLTVSILFQWPGLAYVVFIPAAFGFYALAIYGFFGLIETLYKKDWKE